jgi:hypothetical protein
LFAFDAVLFGLLPFEQIEGKPPERGQVLGGIPLINLRPTGPLPLPLNRESNERPFPINGENAKTGKKRTE